ncbi:hypothetical protein FACS189490_03660 [Clostridia bacterium]|nr:hypothetical protein FACS189490_03660 [Clostridia bacterium]
MDYSMEHTLYDLTLDQRRTNDSVSIAADYGDTVLAAYDGIVTDVYYSKESGTVVAVDLGDGWRATYAQLASGVPVAVGDIVRQGALVGYVGEPSIYSSLLGYHTDFAMTYNESPVNPRNYFAQQ